MNRQAMIDKISNAIKNAVEMARKGHIENAGRIISMMYHRGLNYKQVCAIFQDAAGIDADEFEDISYQLDCAHF